MLLFILESEPAALASLLEDLSTRLCGRMGPLELKKFDICEGPPIVTGCLSRGERMGEGC